MKKVTFTLVLMTIAVLSIGQSFEKGTTVVNLGVGLGGNVLSYSSANRQLAYSLSFEKGLWEVGKVGVVSLGGYGGKSGYKYTGSYGSYSYTEKWNYITIGVRGAFHLTAIKDEKIDLYGGIMIGHNVLSYKYEDTDPYLDYSGGTYGGSTTTTQFLGCRYYFNKKTAAFAELGYGVSYLTAGVSVKL